MNKKHSTLVFVHIPKTAGTTLINILKGKYNNIFQTDGLHPKLTKDEFEGYSVEKQNEFDAIIGHLSLGISKDIKNPILLTYLRDPVDHFISLFHYIKRAKSNRLYESVKNMDSILDFIDFAKEAKEDNLQTRHLSGATDHLTDKSISPNDMNVDGDRLLEKAKENLMKIDYVFHTDQFNKSLIILKNDLQWNSLPFYSSKNKTKNRPKISSLDNSVREKILDLNKYDVELFEFSKKINQKLINSYNIDKELVRFNRLNSLYQKSNSFTTSLNYYSKKILNKF